VKRDANISDAGRHGEEDDDDPLAITDEAALNEFLEDLDVDESDGWNPEATGSGTSQDDESRVAALLASLGRGITPKAQGEETSPRQDDDDSEGEEMSLEAAEILARAQDEIELERKESPAEHDTLAESKEKQGDERQIAGLNGPAKDGPEVRQDAKASDSTGQSGQTPADDSTKNDPFTLPTVPMDLTNPAQPDNDAEHVLDLPGVPTSDVEPPSWEDDIARRMAALGGPGRAVVRDPESGFPSAPTFSPEDRRPEAGGKKKGAKGAGYTDDDMKTWCVVCLEDATVRCTNCDDGDDVYCHRCWQEMHVGPSAGYDERGHKWVKFTRL
jgi:hypothetical protein